MFNLIPLPYRLAGAALLAALFFAAGWTVNGWRWEAAIAAQKAEAAALLQTKTDEARTFERGQQAATNELEKAYDDRADERNRQAEENARLASRLHAALGRVQQPRRGQDGSGAVPGRPDAAACAEHVQAARAELSTALERLAQGGAGIARDADREADLSRLGADFAVKVVNQ